MDRISDIALRSENAAFDEGAEAGFWRGFAAGKWQATQEIMGWVDEVVDPPEEFQPLGALYYPRNFAAKEHPHKETS
jgi:hypothetical protein